MTTASLAATLLSRKRGVYRLRSVDGKRVAPRCLNPQPDGTQAWAIRDPDGLKIELTGKELPERG